MSELAKGQHVMLLRKKKGISQQELADESGVSLRSIQRLENGETTPQGYTLKAIAKVLGETVENLQFNYIETNSHSGQLKWVNMSALCLLAIPFANIILPYIFYKRVKSNIIERPVASRIVSFQIKWTLLTSLLLVITPFVQYSLSSMNIVIRFPLILIVLFITYFYNVIKTLSVASFIQSEDYEKIYPRIKILV